MKLPPLPDPLWGAAYRQSIEAYARTCVKAALEEAAKVCEAKAWTNKNSSLLGPEMNCTECADAIRKLIGEIE